MSTVSRHVVARVVLACVLVLSVSACVPYERYQDVSGQLQIARQVNIDLQSKLKDSERQIAGFQGSDGLSAAQFDALKTKYDSVRGERDELARSLAILEERFRTTDPLTIQGGGFTDRDAAEIGDVTLTSEGLVFDSGLLFAPGKATLRAEAKKSLDKLAAIIAREHSDHIIDIWGHTDVTPIKKSQNKDNYDLGFKRAHAVFSYLTKGGMGDDQFRLHSAGPSEPPSGVDPNTDAGKKESRRVVVQVGRPL